LTGIVKAFGKKQVFFKTPMSAKPGEAAKEASFMLSERERAGEIEILEINEVVGTVRVKNHGIQQDLSLEKDGMKPQAGAGGALPGVPGMGLPGVGAPGASVPGASLTPVPTLNGSGAASLQRPLRGSQSQGVSTPQGFGAPQGFSASQRGPQVQPKAALSPEEQMALKVLQDAYHEKNGDVEKARCLPQYPTPDFTPQ
jgi:hypothetical protein